MATTFTGYNSAEIAQDFLLSLKNALIPLGAVTRKYELTGKRKGDVVRVPKYAGGTPSTRTLGAVGTASGAVTVASITLPDPTHVQWEVVDGVAGLPEFRIMGMEQMKKLAGAILAVPFAEVTASNYGSGENDVFVKSVGDFGLASVGELGAKATAKKLSNPSLVLNGPMYWRLVTAFSAGLLDKSAIVSGVLPNQAGMTAYNYAGLPDNSELLAGVVIDPTALLVGLAPVEPTAASGQGDLISYEIVADDESGIAFSYKVWYESDKGKICGRAEVMVDAEVGNAGIVRIVTGL
jgi:hypothetical protein